MGRVIWTELALVDVEGITAFIAKDSQRYALKVAEQILDSTRRLEVGIRVGWKVPEFNLDHFREILVKPYRIIYEIRGEDCYVVAGNSWQPRSGPALSSE